MVPINYLAVFVAAFVSMGIGFAWYGPVFGGMWKRLMGFTDESLKTMNLSPVQAMAGGFLMALAMSYVLAHVLAFSVAYMGVEGVRVGLSTGFWMWLGFALPITAGVFLWEGKPLKLWVLNAGYYLVSLLVMGVILALWM